MQKRASTDASARPDARSSLRSTMLRTLSEHSSVRFAAVALALGVAVFGFAFWTQQRIEQVVKRQLATALHATVDAATEGVRSWLDDAGRAAIAGAQDSTVANLVELCVAEKGNCDARALEAHLAPYLRAGGFSHFIALDRSGRLHASGPLDVVDTPLPDLSDPRLWSRARAVVLPPTLIAGRPVMRVAAPVAGEGGGVVGSLWFELAVAGFDRILVAARAGQSGETYAFDARGRMVTDSRFVAQLQQIGLLAPAVHNAAFALDVRDPGGDLTRGFVATQPRAQQPLTRMAAGAVRGRDGIDVDGYRDYRGVPVVGAWRWLPEFDVGIVTEVDADEAFRTLHSLREIFAWLIVALAIAAGSVLLVAAVSARMRRRMQRAEQLASRFGQYRILRKIGQGGMGTVYMASHELLRRPAAIKLLREDRKGPEGAARFEREVRLTSSLTHPNTIAVYDYGRAEDGTFYYAMEYLEGLDLQTLGARFGPVPAARVLYWLVQVCGSLAEAHGAGLIHRDIKPANLIACTRGGVADIVKVLDFGVVMSLKRERTSTLRDKIVLGTPEYMAPEMFESAEQASPQSDLYALGAVAYFLLTGRLPFEGRTTAELCMAHLTQEPEALSVALGASPDAVLEAAVLACLAKRREARPSSATALRAWLERSALARAWTQADADAWWAVRADEIAALRAAAEPSEPSASAPRTIRPATQAG